MNVGPSPDQLARRRVVRNYRRASSGRYRILMTVDAVGGVWRYAMELGRALATGRCTVHFAGLGPQPSASQAAEANAIGSLHWVDRPLDWLAEDAGGLEATGAAIQELAVQTGCDMVHLNQPSLALDWSGDIPVVAVMHSCVPSWWKTMRGGDMPADLGWQLDVTRKALQRTDRIVVPSEAFRDLVAGCYGDRHRVNVVHNAIRCAVPAAAKEHFVFAAGRWWDEGKNGSVLDAAARAIRWPVMMAGSQTHPQGGSVAFHHARSLGSLPHGMVLEHMCKAAILVSPSRYEPFGLAPLEGARCATALVLADIPTYRELWDGAAVFFDAGDPDALADAVNGLIDDRRLRREMGARAFARSARYAPERQAACMIEIYDGLFSGPQATVAS
jgi:glycosyltransferase involved in cell wall biosynthesis